MGPPKRAQYSRVSSEREGGILLAIKSIQTKEISSILEEAWNFNMPWSTLRDRLNGTTSRVDIRANNDTLTN
jgi:hypothetical protein